MNLASDVDQFLDELFSPVLDGSLDELSDARSLAASIRGGGGNIRDFIEAPPMNDASLNILENPTGLAKAIKGGGSKTDKKPSTSSTLDLEVEAINNPNEVSLDEYITGTSNFSIRISFSRIYCYSSSSQTCFNRFSLTILFVD